MKQNFCVKCNKDTDCVLVNKKEEFHEIHTQCLVCGAVSASMSFPPGTTLEFKGGWTRLDELNDT